MEKFDYNSWFSYYSKRMVELGTEYEKTEKEFNKTNDLSLAFKLNYITGQMKELNNSDNEIRKLIHE